MIELKGKYGLATVYASVVDEASLSQVVELLNQPYAAGSKIRMMPDIHAGVGCTIGTTMTIYDKVCPNLVGVDIGCGMETVKIRERQIDWEKLDSVIRSRVPSGFNIHAKEHEFASQIDLNELFCSDRVDIHRAYRSIGTLGGGNHFIEADRADDGSIYIVVHSGSRHLGVEIANYYQNKAYRAVTSHKDEIQKIIRLLKQTGREREIESYVKNIYAKHSETPKNLAYVEGELFDSYIHDMRIAQRFAKLNRIAITETIIDEMGFHVEERFTTIHNYIDTDKMILRKGAVSAQAGERLLIPINMRDGSLLCTGKGNSEWNFSAPHGAGRIMSRSAAKEMFTVQEFEKQMCGVYTTSVGRNTLDECPMAYKSINDIVENIEPTVTIDAVIKPVYNFKAGDDK